MHFIIALDTLSYDAEDLRRNVAVGEFDNIQLREGKHLATPEVRLRFKQAVRRFRDTFTPEFIASQIGESDSKATNIEVLSDFRSPSIVRGRYHKIGFVAFAYLDARDETSNPDGTDLLFYSTSSIEGVIRHAKAVGRVDAQVFLVVLIPYQQNRATSLERFKQLEFEVDGQRVEIPNAPASTLVVFVDSPAHRAKESRRRFCYELTYNAGDFAEDTSAHESLLTLRKVTELGLANYDADSRKRTVRGQPVVSAWSEFLIQAKPEVLSLIRSMLVGEDATVPLPVVAETQSDDDASDNDIHVAETNYYDDMEMYYDR